MGSSTSCVLGTTKRSACKCWYTTGIAWLISQSDLKERDPLDTVAPRGMQDEWTEWNCCNSCTKSWWFMPSFHWSSHLLWLVYHLHWSFTTCRVLHYGENISKYQNFEHSIWNQPQNVHTHKRQHLIMTMPPAIRKHSWRRSKCWHVKILHTVHDVKMFWISIKT